MRQVRGIDYIKLFLRSAATLSHAQTSMDEVIIE